MKGREAAEAHRNVRQHDRHRDELSSEFGLVFLKRGRHIYRELSQAQQTYAAARQAAVDAGVLLEIDLVYQCEFESDGIFNNEPPIRKPVEDTYNRKRISDWIEDSDRPAKHTRRTRPEPYEVSQLFDYVPVQPQIASALLKNAQS